MMGIGVSFVFRRSVMFRRTHLIALGMLALGSLLGYAAATGRLNPFRQAGAAEGQAAQQPGGDETPGPARGGADRGQVIARAAQKDGKKPNIVFIMGDDVGWFNIGAYHRGIMSGKTPNLDKLAAQGMLFT